MEINWAKMVPELMVSDFDVSLAFYELLGFQVLFVREGFAYLEFEGAQLMLEQFDESGWHVGTLEKPYGRGVNFQIECANATAVRNKMVQVGHALYRDLKDTWRQTGDTISGAREFLIQDPDGYLLRFAEELEV
jgi:catechol 2,3-dioxygenase-like lactoylglutathione lyase family enzyme